MNTARTCDRRTFTKLALAGAFGFGAGAARAAGRPDFWILRDEQTPARDQQDHGTCYVFAAIAALEAAYKRAGYGTLDLSEEFVNEAVRLFWLEPRPGKNLPAHRAENRFSMGQGGFEDGVVNLMAECGFAVPEEKHMPYRGNPMKAKCPASPTWPDWNLQRKLGSFNLDPRRFDGAALAKAKFYGVRSCHDRPGNDPAAIEEALRKGREVVWGFSFAGDRAGWCWEAGAPVKPSDGCHAMMIYGFDRSDAGRPYFIVKNSWKGMEDVYISYAYVRRYGKAATTIVEVAPPRSWPELAYVGRWALTLDGRTGTLDIYHLPGMSKTAFDFYDLTDRRTGKLMEDRRLGTFFPRGGKLRDAFRVNGEITKDGLTLNLDWSEPACDYAHRDGQEFTLRFAGADRDTLNGTLLCGGERGEKVVAKRVRDPREFEIE
jgi:hypothetical protein